MRLFDLFRSVACLLLALALSSCGGGVQKYQTVAGDPYQALEYTLDNGLKVFMSVNHDEPRIQTCIAVRVGSKDDPHDNTGLAHYLEHIMFKGTERFGTSDFEKEKPLLDEIERLFELHKASSDPLERQALYHQIDSLSYEASLIAIPNEYDKLMATIGSNGSNAYTSCDMTCYIEDIPSNRIEEWAEIQADRLMNPVIRGFHTELEAVYEEYNSYLNEDSENAQMAMDSILFKKHPYGQQSVLGTSEHLKSPSITAIKNQLARYYVPNNTAICLSGDFDPDEMVAVIEKYFGGWQKNETLSRNVWPEEDEILSPEVRHVYGTDEEFVLIGWRTPSAGDPGSDISELVVRILHNGASGLLDMDVTLKQKILDVGTVMMIMTDHGEYLMQGYPKEGQSLEEVRDVLLDAVARLRTGDFDESLVKAAWEDANLTQQEILQDNYYRAEAFANAFVSYKDWKDSATQLDRLSKVTKQDIMDFASEYLKPEAYGIVYKHVGVNPRNEKIEAPEITPIATNRDVESAFLTRIKETVATPIEPRFVDYAKDMSRKDLSDGIELLSVLDKNTSLASVEVRFNEGLLRDPYMKLALDYLDYLGTPSLSAEDRASLEYNLTGFINLNADVSYCSYGVSGLSENLPRLLEVVEDLILNAQGDDQILEELKEDLLYSREAAKLSQASCNLALWDYVFYGPEYIRQSTLTTEQIRSVTSEELLAKVRGLLSMDHKVLYCGPEAENEVSRMILGHHHPEQQLRHVEALYPTRQLITESKVFLAPYETRQLNYIQASCRADSYELSEEPVVQLFNDYFGSGVNNIVYQEIREARALAYSAQAMLSSPAHKRDHYQFYATIDCQNDKLQQAVEAFDEIINFMPDSEKALDIAKSSLDAVLRSKRVLRSSILDSYLLSEQLGLSEPVEKFVFEKLSSLDLDDLKACQQKWVKDRVYYYGILGDTSSMDMDFLKTLGQVTMLSLEEIFGY